ncbi:hypothetical protein RJT34_19366 [Clitoria ternatea]|uniref:Uncharacterized protein n=1 Tax=Clitoria ternatea TaxID=43366 RepID=A0AAN9IQX1_CLITE
MKQSLSDDLFVPMTYVKTSPKQDAPSGNTSSPLSRQRKDALLDNISFVVVKTLLGGSAAPSVARPFLSEFFPFVPSEPFAATARSLRQRRRQRESSVEDDKDKA